MLLKVLDFNLPLLLRMMQIFLIFRYYLNKKAPEVRSFGILMKVGLCFCSSFHFFSIFFGKEFLSHTDEIRGYLDGLISLDVFHAFFQ